MDVFATEVESKQTKKFRVVAALDRKLIDSCKTTSKVKNYASFLSSFTSVTERTLYM